MTPRENGSEQEPVIRDNRKIDPETGQVRERAMPDPGDILDSAPETEAESRGKPEKKPDGPTIAEDLATQLAERTADLQRVTAEYANYRKRVERDRVAVRELAVANVVSELLPVLDDIGRARDHGELTGGFAKVSESLEAAVAKLGLVSFGTKGDPFDPTVHEALMHSYSSEVSETTCVEILQPGYRIGDRILRPARVAVAEPDGSEPAQASQPEAEASGETAEPADGSADESAKPAEPGDN
ncbi:nucleotide exchange factor GrpE [Thermopolyspora sp. NPDC052614]|uniref:nucleotide exchange factor GrpE n=1 Tax=Thermopolyspora sp. NPDC052614 TaxID=3155682 RepID=UPI00343E13B9